MTWNFDDDPLISIRNQQRFAENKINELEAQVEKLKKVCFFYSEEVYRFIGNFRRDNLDPKQIDALNILKTIIDDCIEDEGYSSKLYHLYIAKDYYRDVNSPSLKEELKELNKSIYTDLDCKIGEEDE